jgi:translation initiation factor 6
LSVKLADISGNPYIGVFCRLIDGIMLAPPEASDQFAEMAEESLSVKVVRTSLAGANLHGSLIAANGSGMIAPYFFDRSELERSVRSAGEGELDDMVVELSDDPVTAWGNNLLLGERTAIANPDLSKDTLRKVGEVLDIEVVPMTLAGIMTVGSIAVMNSKGLVVHPKTTENEMDELRSIFKREVAISTANFGSPYLGASVVANDHGALIGTRSSGVEINRIENTLDLIV